MLNKLTTWSDVSWVLLEASFDNKVVLVKAITDNNELHQHKLDLTGLSQDADGDILAKIGLSMYRPTVLPVIEDVLPNGAAELAGLKAGDRINRINDVPVETWSAVVSIIKANPGNTLQVEIEREHSPMNVLVTPDTVKESNEEVGKIGAAVKVVYDNWSNFLERD